MSYALEQLTEFPSATYNGAANLNTAPKVANLNSAPHFTPITHEHSHYLDETGFSCAVSTAGPMITLN